MSPRQAGEDFAPQARRKMRVTVLIIGLLLLVPLLLAPFVVAGPVLASLESLFVVQKPVGVFRDGDAALLLTASQQVEPLASAPPHTAGLALWTLDDVAVTGIRELDAPPDFALTHVGGVFGLSGAVYVAHADELIEILSGRRVALPESAFLLASCLDAEFVWLLIKDTEGLKLTRFDGERLTTPVLAARPLKGSWRAGKRHHAALLPVENGWLLIAGTESGALYKVLPQGREDFWAGIPWQPAPFERANWLAYTHKGKPRVLALGLRQMLNPLRLAYLLVTDPFLKADVYGFEASGWRLLRSLRHPMIGENFADASRIPGPALVVASAMRPDGGWELYRFDTANRGERPWRALSMLIEGPLQFSMAELIGWGLRVSALWVLGLLLAVVVLDRLMIRWRSGGFTGRDGGWFRYAPLWRRGLARLVDLLCVFLPVFGIAVMLLPFWLDTNQMGDREFQRRVAGALLLIPLGLILFPLLFWSLLEWLTGQTPGKWLLRIRVLDARTQHPPSLRRAFIRNVLLVAESSTYGLAALLCIPASRGQRRVGDMVARTCVVMDLAPVRQVQSEQEERAVSPSEDVSGS